MGIPGSAGIELSSTCPQSEETDGARYRQQVAEIARCSKMLDRLERLARERRPDAPAAPEEQELRGAITPQALAVGALVGLFLTAGIALALLGPRAQHVDSGWE